MFKLLNFITNGSEDRVNLALKPLIFPLVSKGEVNLTKRTIESTKP
jgi:hypothetical protein